MEPLQISTIALVESCYKQKFGIPRQPGLVPGARGVIRFLPEFAVPEAFDGLEQSSHIWVQFIFHGIAGLGSGSWSPRVRPPRLGGNKKAGVFATRSTYRPNSLGLSVVRLDEIDTSNGVALHVSGIDFLEGTPVVDIKPYIPYADMITEARNHLAEEPPEYLKVRFSALAEQQISCLQPCGERELKQLIIGTLQQDPRPAYQREDDRVYGTKLLGFDLNWRYLTAGDTVEVEVVGLTKL